MANDNGNACVEGGSRLLTDSDAFRNCSLAFNGDLYTKGDVYDENSSYIMNKDGDGRGRDPQEAGDINDAGTVCDFKEREKMLAKNSNLYTCGNEYSAGSNNI